MGGWLTDSVKFYSETSLTNKKAPASNYDAEGIICGTTSGLKIPHEIFLTECNHTRTLYWAFPAYPTNESVQAAAPGCILSRSSPASHQTAGL